MNNNQPAMPAVETGFLVFGKTGQQIPQQFLLKLRRYILTLGPSRHLMTLRGYFMKGLNVSK